MNKTDPLPLASISLFLLKHSYHTIIINISRGEPKKIPGCCLSEKLDKEDRLARQDVYQYMYVYTVLILFLHTCTAYGKVKAFNPKVDEWDVYEEQSRFYMVASNITDAAKKAVDPTYSLRRSDVQTPSQFGIRRQSGRRRRNLRLAIVELLKSHFKYKQSVVVRDVI